MGISFQELRNRLNDVLFENSLDIICKHISL